MGLAVKAKKCRSLSISDGKPTVIDFSLAREQIASVQNNPIKFLGSHITFKMKTSKTYDFIRDKVDSTLTNIDSVNIKNEYKLKILNDYALSSMRYMLTVHDLHATHLGQLDTLLDKYIKKWMGIPRCGANIAVVHALDQQRARE